MDNDYQNQVAVFKAFCDENRLKILELLRGGEKCACKLLEYLNMGQSSLSYHMKILVESGVVDSRQEGKWTHYRISMAGSQYALDLLKSTTTISADNISGSCCE